MGSRKKAHQANSCVRAEQFDFSMNFHIFGNMKESIAIAVLVALSQETRLDIFRYLVQLGAPGAPAGQIAERLGLPAATLSFHLNTLKQADLVRFRRKGRSLIYTANFDTMNNLLAYLTENCCAGQAEARAITSCEPAEASHHE